MAEIKEFDVDWQATGQSVQVPQYEFTVDVVWVDDDGIEHAHSGTYRFPNVLASVPQRKLRLFLEDIIRERAAVAIGVISE